MQRINRLTGKELANKIIESSKPKSKGMGYRVASLAHAANYNAFKDFCKNNTQSAESKTAASDAIRLPALTKSIFDSVANEITLQFWEHDSKNNQEYLVDFHMEDVYRSYKDMIIFYGGIKIANRKVKKGYVSYIFAEGAFYRGYVTTYDDFKKQRLIEVDVKSSNNVELVNKLLTHISNFMYSEEDYEHFIDVNGPTRSKFRDIRRSKGDTNPSA